jgi:hypothetical protein
VDDGDSGKVRQWRVLFWEADLQGGCGGARFGTCRDLDSGIPGSSGRVGLVSYGLGESKQAEMEIGEGPERAW